MSPKSWILGATLATAMALPISPASAAGETVAVNLYSLSNPFFNFMRQEVLDEAKKLDIKVIIQDAQASTPKQASDLENALTQGVDAIVLTPTDVTAIAPAVDEVIEDDVPVVAVDRRVEGTSKPVPYVTADNIAGGRLQGEWVTKNMPQGARVALITGQIGSTTHIDRAKGIHEALKAGGDKYKVVAEQSAQSDRAKALSVVQNIVTANPDNPPDVFIATDGDMALGAVEAIRGLGLSSKSKVVAFDAYPDVIKAVKAGELVGVVEQNGSKQIRTAVQMIVDKIRNDTEPKTVIIDPIMITAQNLEQAERYSEVK
jgi:inositol transport system substrate-binding protein